MKQGPARRVTCELPRERMPERGDYRWSYELECGHVVERRGPGRTWCYCETCAALNTPTPIPV